MATGTGNDWLLDRPRAFVTFTVTATAPLRGNVCSKPPRSPGSVGGKRRRRGPVPQLTETAHGPAPAASTNEPSGTVTGIPSEPGWTATGGAKASRTSWTLAPSMVTVSRPELATTVSPDWAVMASPLTVGWPSAPTGSGRTRTTRSPRCPCRPIRRLARPRSSGPRCPPRRSTSRRPGAAGRAGRRPGSRSCRRSRPGVAVVVERDPGPSTVHPAGSSRSRWRTGPGSCDRTSMVTTSPGLARERVPVVLARARPRRRSADRPDHVGRLDGQRRPRPRAPARTVFGTVTVGQGQRLGDGPVAVGRRPARR